MTVEVISSLHKTQVFECEYVYFQSEKDINQYIGESLHDVALRLKESKNWDIFSAIDPEKLNEVEINAASETMLSSVPDNSFVELVGSAGTRFVKTLTPAFIFKGNDSCLLFSDRYTLTDTKEAT